MSRICFGLLLVCGQIATGAPVRQGIRLRLIDIETGKPAEGLYVDLIGGKGKEARSKPPVPPSAVPIAWDARTDTTGPTSIDGVTPAIAYYRDGFGLKVGETSMFKVAGIYSSVVDGGTGARYVSCADQAIFRTEEVLKYGSMVKNLDPWCPNKEAPAQVQAAPGEIVMFVHSMKGMPAAEIRVRVIEIDTLKPAKGLYVEAGQVRVPTSYGLFGAGANSNIKAEPVRVPTSVDGVAHFSVPAPSSREIRDTGYFRVTAIVFPSDEHWCTLSWSVGKGGTIEEILKYGSKPVPLVGSRGCNSVSRYWDEVEAAPGEIVAFVRRLTWWERIHNWFYDSIKFGDQTIH